MRIMGGNFFNMVEMTLSVGALAIGAMAIISILPVLFEQNRDIISGSYSSDAVASIHAYITGMACSDSQWNTSSAFSSIPESRTGWEFSDIDGSRAVLDSEWSGSPIPGTTCIYDLAGYNASGRGTYGVKFITEGVSDSCADFTGQFLVWRTRNPIVQSRIPGGNIKTTDSTNTDRLLGINIEMSWPAEKPYSTRTKAVYYFEIYNYGLYASR